MARNIAIFGGSFNPPCVHHQAIAQMLAKRFDGVVVVPCGIRKDKNSANIIDPRHRGEMAVLAFGGLPTVTIDLFDLQNNSFTPTFLIQERYEKKFPGDRIWHVIGGDIILGGKEGNSEIQRVWREGKKIWNLLRYAVVRRPGYAFAEEDMPPHSELMEIGDGFGCSGTVVRERIRKGLAIDGLVDPKVRDYVERQGLYK